MHLYRVSTSAGTETFVFARDFDEATSLFSIWNLVNDGVSGHFTITRVNPSNAGEDEESIRDALSLGLIGIGTLHPQQGWQILPPDHVDGDQNDAPGFDS